MDESDHSGNDDQQVPAGIKIRPATSPDLEGIRAYDPAARHPFRVNWLEDHVRQGNCLVAVREGRIVGHAVFAHTFYLMGFVEALRVVAAHRRQGIATALLRHAESRCTTDRIFTSTNASNTPMHRLLPQLGYVPCGIIDLDPGDPEIVYVKRLTRAGAAVRAPTL
ncbi:GNAT family N-acetyltransferase [bacterium]|nr:GNAT family N-acetyltransferase [bacterium]